MTSLFDSARALMLALFFAAGLANTSSAQCAGNCDADQVDIELKLIKVAPLLESASLTITDEVGEKVAQVGQVLKPVKIRRQEEYPVTIVAVSPYIGGTCPLEVVRLIVPCGIETLLDGVWATGDRGLHNESPATPGVNSRTWNLKLRIKPTEKEERGSDHPDADENNAGASAGSGSSPGTQSFDASQFPPVVSTSPAAVSATIPLGYVQANGRSAEAGNLSLSYLMGAGSLTTSSFEIRSLFFNPAAPTDVQNKVRWATADPAGDPRIAISEEAAVRISNTASGVLVEAFRAEDFNPATSAFSGAPISRYDFSRLNGGQRLVLTQWIGGETQPSRVWEYEVDGWKLTAVVDGVKTESEEIQDLDATSDATILASTRVSVRKEFQSTPGGEVCVSMVVEEYGYLSVREVVRNQQGVPTGLGALIQVDEVLLSRRQDLDAVFGTIDGPVEQWNYYGREGELTFANYHLLGLTKMALGSSGDWTLYGYDSAGEVGVIFEPWLSTPPPAALGIVDEGTDAGSPVKKTVIYRQYATGTTSTTTKSWLVEGASSTLIADRSDNSSSGGSASTLSYDGEAVTHVRELTGTWTAGAGDAWAEFDGAAVNPSHRMTVTTRGTQRSTGHQFSPGNFAVLPLHSTQEIVITGGDGVILRETRVLPGSPGSEVDEADFEPATRESYVYEDGRETQVIRDGREVSGASYPSAFETVSTDQSGIETSTLTDARGRVVSVTTAAGGGVPAITHSTEYLGLETRQLVNGVLVSRSVEDRAGRTVHQEDQTGAAISWYYSPDGSQTVETRPGNVQVTTATHRDGRIASVTGGGIIQLFYSYGVEEAAATSGESEPHFNLTTTERTGTIEGARYRKSIHSWVDGSLLETRSPDAASGMFEVVLKPGHAEFGGQGSYERSTALDPAFSTTASSAASAGFRADTAAGSMGMELLSGQVEGWNSSGPTGATRLSRSEKLFVKEDGRWWETSVHTTGIEEANATRQSYSKTRLWEGDGSKSVSQSAGGETTTTTTVFNRAAKESVTTTALSGSVVPMISHSVNSYVQWTQDRHSADPAHRAAFTYDGFGRVQSARDHRGGNIRTVYNGFGQVTATIDTLGRATVYAYHGEDVAAAGQVKSITWPDGTTSTYSYTDRGELQSVGGTSEYPVSYTYNAHGDRETLTTTNAAGNPVTRWEYNAAGLLKYKFHDWQPGDVPEATTGTLIHSYDPFGRLRSLEVVGGKITGYAHNLFGELGEIYYGNDPGADVIVARDDSGAPEVVTEHFEDADGNALGSGTTTHGYAAGRLDSVQYSADHPFLPDVKLDYKDLQAATGRPTGYDVTAGGANRLDVSYGYDSAGRLETVASQQHGHFQYRYHPGSGIASGYADRDGGAAGAVVIDQNRPVDFQHRISSVVTRNGANQVMASVGYTYDKRDRRTEARREDGSYWRYGYNSRGEVTSAARHAAGGAAIDGLERQYQYDAIGNREWAKFGGGASGGALTKIDYTVNGHNQYSGIETPGKEWVVGVAPENEPVKVNGNLADRQGIWFSKELSAANSSGPVKLPVAVTDANDDLVKDGDLFVPKAGTAPSHDPAGSLETDGRWEYQWDSANRLRKMTPTPQAIAAGFPNQIIEFVYDWQGRRIAKKVTEGGSATHTRYLYEGWNMVAEWSFTGTSLPAPQTYLWGLDLVGQYSGEVAEMQEAGGVSGLLAVKQEPGALEFFAAYDGNGNITGWINASGLLTGRQEFDPFGNRTALEGSVDLPMRFSTKYQDEEAGLYYFGFRWLDSLGGRWVSKDPIEEEGGGNLYGFVANDSLNRWDFVGLDFIAAGTRPLSFPVGLLGGPGLPANHLSIEYFTEDEGHKGSATLGLKFTKHNLPDGASPTNKKVELNPTSSYGWRRRDRDLGPPHRRGIRRNERILVQISTIRETGFGERYLVVKCDASKADWNKIKTLYGVYKHAEKVGFRNGDRIKKWPSSRYDILGNNSNTFVRKILRDAGHDVGDDFFNTYNHPGNFYPDAIQDARPVPSYLD